MIHPVEPFIIAQEFGIPGQFYTDQGLLGHNGIDLAIPNGTSVHCTNPRESFVHKIVEETAGSTGTRGKGMWCVEKEPDGQGRYLVTIYWHLQDFLFQENDTVKEGDVIALSNNTGQSSGPHLHFGVKYYAKNSTGDFYTLNINNGYGGFIDPMPFFDMKVTTEELAMLYKTVFGRDPDAGSFGYIGKDLSFVLGEFQKSPEWKAKTSVLQTIDLEFNVKL